MSYLVSLIIPVYKAENFIKKTMISICEQTLKNFEIILIDDCSPDASINIAISVLKKYPTRFNASKIVRFEKNVGIANVRKHAINLATGKYIASIDSDDYFELYALEKMLESIENSQSDIAFFDYYNTYSGKNDYIIQKIGGDKEETIRYLLMNKLHGSLCNKLYKKDILDNIIILDDINMSEDLLITIQAVFISKKISYHSEAFLYYVQHNSHSLTKKYNNKKIKDMIVGIQFIENFFVERNVYISYKPALDYRKQIIKAESITHADSSQRKMYYNLFPNLKLNYNDLGWYKSIILFLAEKKIFLLINIFIYLRQIIKLSVGR